MRGALLAIAAVALLWLVACASSGPIPDLGGLYNELARYHGEERNPIIVIPGILGTKLIDPDTGQIVWGAFGGGAANPQRPEGARLLALPMREGAELEELGDTVVTDGVLESFRVKMAGIPFKLKAYFHILTALGAGGYRDEDIHLGTIDYGEEHFTCFQFAYDWRRDNVENVRRLHEFIEEKRAYVLEESQRRFGRVDPDLKFDLITHSLGALLLRYYLRYGAVDLPDDGSLPPLTWAGSQHVERAVLIGAPNAGSLDALAQLLEGRKFGPLTPRYEAALIGTFPAIYQSLPRVRHGAVVEEGDLESRVDFMDPAIWDEMGWGLLSTEQEPVLQTLLPEVEEPAARRRIARDHLRKSLLRATRFHAALDAPASPPEGLDLYLIAGDAVPTAKLATLDRSTGVVSVVGYAPGDGTVLRSSALMDERVGGAWSPNLQSPVHWSNVMFLFSDHLGMTKDPAFTDNVLYLLLEDPRNTDPGESAEPEV